MGNERMGKVELVLFITAIASCIFYFVLLHSTRLEKWAPLLDFAGLLAGFIGFVFLLVWNGLMQRTSLGKINAFLTVWMFVYLMLKAFFGGAS